ncbi:MAG: family 20 glycosylhydrolase [Candidatus Hydrogenedentes bacterium]|nr:family 20 glycosylhydrolase [Candidatus Hydrogenedentota bacterium]
MRCWKTLVIIVPLVMAGCATTPRQATPKEAWRGVHLGLGDRSELPVLHRTIKEVLVPNGVNTLVLEVNYGYEFQSHPELRLNGAMTREDARALAELCREQGVRLIPQFQCFGHQGNRPDILLRTYPELMAPPKPNYDDPDHYQVSWNPLDPKTNEIVLALIDELIEAFDAEYFHVGLDEVMLFPDATTPYYNGETHAQVFAKAVNDLHDHIAGKRGLTMLMWGDRLIDLAEFPYNRYEASDNGTAPAIDLIPRDIIICDWHYTLRKDYPSVQYFQEKGFKVWPSSWKSSAATLALMTAAQDEATDRMIGHLCTTWCGIGPFYEAAGADKADGKDDTERAARAFKAAAGAW